LSITPERFSIIQLILQVVIRALKRGTLLRDNAEGIRAQRQLVVRRNKSHVFWAEEFQLLM
jgi:hypothetical protein